MSPTATAVISPENVLHVADSNRSGAVSPVSISTGSKTVAASDDLNVALAQIVQSVTDRSESASRRSSLLISSRVRTFRNFRLDFGCCCCS